MWVDGLLLDSYPGTTLVSVVLLHWRLARFLLGCFLGIMVVLIFDPLWNVDKFLVWPDLMAEFS